MTEAWVKLVQYLTTSLGFPGSMAVCLCCYLIYLLGEERKAHSSTRDKIDAINEKRIELHATYMQAIRDLKESLEAVTAILGKK